MNDKVKQFLAGNIAGWGALTVSQPLDYIKTQLQINYKIPSFSKIFKEIGFFGFYRGASSLYISIGLTTYLQFTIYETIMQKMNKFTCHKDHNIVNLGNVVVAGLACGFITSFLYTPIQYSKILSQVNKKKTIGSAQRIFLLLKNQRLGGLKKLMTGIQWTLLRQVPGCGIYYVTYNYFLFRVFQESRNNASVYTNILCGGISGVLYQVYIYPLDVIKTNVQSGKSTFNQLIKVKFWKAPVFKTGFGISLLRSFITDAANWSIYQNARKFMGLKFQHPIHEKI